MWLFSCSTECKICSSRLYCTCILLICFWWLQYIKMSTRATSHKTEVQNLQSVNMLFSCHLSQYITLYSILLCYPTRMHIYSGPKMIPLVYQKDLNKIYTIICARHNFHLLHGQSNAGSLCRICSFFTWPYIFSAGPNFKCSPINTSLLFMRRSDAPSISYKT